MADRRMAVHRHGADLARSVALDNVLSGRSVLCADWFDQRADTMVYAALAAGADRGRDYHILGVPDRLHRQPGTGVARVGLQRDARQCSGADMPAVQSAVDPGGRAGHFSG